MTVRQHVSMPRLIQSTAGGSTVCPTVTIAWGPNFGEADELPIGQRLTLGTLALAATRTLGSSPSVPSLALAGTRTLGVSPLISALSMSATRRLGTDIPEIVYSIPSLLAVQDTWVPEVALCPDNLNKNGTNLQVDGVALTRKDAYMQFKTDALVGAGQTCVVNSASLTLNIVVPPLASTVGLLRAYTNVTGAFDETTAICSTVPPASAGTTNQNVTVPAATGDLVITLDAGLLLILAAEMNAQRRMLFDFLGNNATTIFSAQSKDSGGLPGNAFGPRLAINYSIVNP